MAISKTQTTKVLSDLWKEAGDVELLKPRFWLTVLAAVIPMNVIASGACTERVERRELWIPCTAENVGWYGMTVVELSRYNMADSTKEMISSLEVPRLWLLSQNVELVNYVYVMYILWSQQKISSFGNLTKKQFSL